MVPNEACGQSPGGHRYQSRRREVTRYVDAIDMADRRGCSVALLCRSPNSPTDAEELVLVLVTCQLSLRLVPRCSSTNRHQGANFRVGFNDL